jgi:C4-dicarboxylate-specific signal transduction histidine kinase
MDFSKPSQPKLALTDINKSLEEAINLSSVTLKKKGIQLEKSLGCDMPLCLADHHLIEQVILNLVTNAAQAMEHTKQPKIIQIKTHSENNHVVVTVADSGPGVPPDLKDKIFEPFFTTKSDSSGIGLSISHRIVSDHGGSLDASTSKWGGAEFVLRLPQGNKEG